MSKFFSKLIEQDDFVLRKDYIHHRYFMMININTYQTNNDKIYNISK